jgi:alpha-glucosidase
LDGFAGAMTRLRGAYDALQQTWPIADAPDPLIDAMQTGDRLGYHPERAFAEISHFHDILPQAQASVQALATTYAQHVNDASRSVSASSLTPAEIEVQKQRRLDSFARAERLVAEANK